MEVVTFWEKDDGKLIMTFRRLQEREKFFYKRLVEEILKISEIEELSRVPWSCIDKIILSKLNIN